ncbi:MAG: hypothetical protein IIY21_20390 [Clostridiales bacterium]|nr:hypothetical protein [Clostridiales bacterium]
MSINGVKYTVEVKIGPSYRDDYLVFDFDNITDAMRMVEAFMINLNKELSAENAVIIRPQLVEEEEEGKEEENDEREIEG